MISYGDRENYFVMMDTCEISLPTQKSTQTEPMEKREESAAIPAARHAIIPPRGGSEPDVADVVAGDLHDPVAQAFYSGGLYVFESPEDAQLERFADNQPPVTDDLQFPDEVLDHDVDIEDPPYPKVGI